MDNKKIGNLIATLRKAKGLTQQELGDMVGIGFRAVSKWERGITMPDISIINDLSKILGITSDELLSGEVKEKPKENKKSSKTIKITISILTIIILIITTITIHLTNKTYVYEITQVDGTEHYIEGQVTFKNKKINIIINKLMFLDKNFTQTSIKNYNYEIYSDKNYIFGYSNNPNSSAVEESITIEGISKNFRMNYNGENVIKRKTFIKNKLIIKFNFIDENNQIITKEIECIIY